jgi:hypothetical protein
MIEIRISPTGDRATAETPEAARLAARTLLREARDQGCGRPTAAFTVDGVYVADGLTRQEV